MTVMEKMRMADVADNVFKKKPGPTKIKTQITMKIKVMMKRVFKFKRIYKVRKRYVQRIYILASVI